MKMVCLTTEQRVKIVQRFYEKVKLKQLVKVQRNLKVLQILSDLCIIVLPVPPESEM